MHVLGNIEQFSVHLIPKFNNKLVILHKTGVVELVKLWAYFRCFNTMSNFLETLTRWFRVNKSIVNVTNLRSLYKRVHWFFYVSVSSKSRARRPLLRSLLYGVCQFLQEVFTILFRFLSIVHSFRRVSLSQCLFSSLLKFC